jgi:Family of unknown function (DUF6328)
MGSCRFTLRSGLALEASVTGPIVSSDDSAHATGPSSSEQHDADAEHLDDARDREELRTRYYSLLQENRVLLPGVQILVAFLVTVPFNDRFADLDTQGEVAWTLGLALGCVAVVCLMSPIVFHRVGERTSRSARLVWAIRSQRAGIVTFAGSLLVSVVFVTRFVRGPSTAMAVLALLLASMVFLWVFVPLYDSKR